MDPKKLPETWSIYISKLDQFFIWINNSGDSRSILTNFYIFGTRI